jgi:hypothetical protein
MDSTGTPSQTTIRLMQAQRICLALAACTDYLTLCIRSPETYLVTGRFNHTPTAISENLIQIPEHCVVATFKNLRYKKRPSKVGKRVYELLPTYNCSFVTPVGLQSPLNLSTNIVLSPRLLAVK